MSTWTKKEDFAIGNQKTVIFNNKVVKKPLKEDIFNEEVTQVK